MSDDLDPDVREIIRRRIALSERDGHERLWLNHEALLALLDAADERDKLAAAVERVRAMRAPHIWTEAPWPSPDQCLRATAGGSCVRVGMCGDCGRLAPCMTVRYLDGDHG